MSDPNMFMIVSYIWVRVYKIQSLFGKAIQNHIGDWFEICLIKYGTVPLSIKFKFE